MHWRTGVVLAACVSLAGCSSGGGKPASKGSASPRASAKASLHLTLKKPLTLTLTAATSLSPGASATFYGYQQPVAVGRSLDALAQRFAFGVADVQVCVGSKPAELAASITDRKSWVLRYADGTSTAPAAIHYPQEPHPLFPFVTSGPASAPNSCIRGKIVYPVPRASIPTSIGYDPSGYAGTLTFRFR